MAHYVMEEMNIPYEDGRERLFPRLIGLQSLSHEDLVNHIARHSGFERGLVEGVLMHVVDCMGELMGERGASLHIDGLGTFTPRLALKHEAEQADEIEDRAHRNARSICVGGVSFRPDRELVRNIDDNCDLQRSPYRDTIRPNASPYTLEQRQARLTAYLSATPFIGGMKYAELAAMPLTAARKELHSWSEGDDALLVRQGRGSHRVYILRV